MNLLLLALKAIAEPTRLRILLLCSYGELSVTELVQIMGQSQPRISRHLKLLSEAGLLERFREGSWVFHRISNNGTAASVGIQLLKFIDSDDPAIKLDHSRLTEVKKNRAEKASNYFMINAVNWDHIRSLHIDDKEVERELSKLFPKKVDDFLDMGTGTGRMLQLFSKRIKSGHGIDLSRDMLAVARANLEESKIRHCTVRHNDAYQLKYPLHSFDVVTIHQVLHFMDDPIRAISEAARVLRPNGILLIVDFAPHSLDEFRTEYSHRRLGFSDDEVKSWCEKNALMVQNIRHLHGDPLTVTIWSARALATN